MLLFRRSALSEHCSFQIITMFQIVARFKTPGLMLCHGDRSQISQMKVTDGWGTVCCRHFLDVEGFGFLCPNYSQMKMTDGWRRSPSYSAKDETASRCMVVLCPRNDWWGSRFSWLDTSYLNMRVKLVMEKTRASHEAPKLEYICGVHALG